MREVKAAIKQVVDAWQLPDGEQWLSPDGLAVAALLCNSAAKAQENGGFCEERYPYFYDLKPLLVNAAAKVHNFCWTEPDEVSTLVYFETCIGQVSFHVFPDSEPGCYDLLPAPNGRVWNEIEMQEIPELVGWEFLGQDAHHSSHYDRVMGW